MRSPGGEAGQATVDYAGLLALVAVLLAVAAAVTAAGAPGVVNAVAGQLRHALCVVGGGACPPPPRRPCTVASTRELRHVALNVALVRLDADRIVMREHLSDGTFRLTVAHRGAAGVEVGVGGRAELDARGRSLGGGREARAGVQGVLGRGSVFYARSEREADALLRALRRPGGRRRGRGGPAPAPREVFVDGGVRALGRVDVGAARALGGRLDGVADAVLGARRDRRTGELTISLGAGGAGAGLVAIAVGGNAGALDGQAVLGLTLDRRRRPVELTLSAGGTVAAGDLLPPGLARPLELTADPGAALKSGGRRWELSARASLIDPAVADAWRAFRRAPASPAAIRALGEQLRSRARLDVRTLRVDSASDGVGASLALGLRIGGELQRAVDRARLVAAATRPPLGLWEPRTDCVVGTGGGERFG